MHKKSRSVVLSGHFSIIKDFSDAIIKDDEKNNKDLHHESHNQVINDKGVCNCYLKAERNSFNSPHLSYLDSCKCKTTEQIIDK